jgi:hypothetical protein
VSQNVVTTELVRINARNEIQVRLIPEKRNVIEDGNPTHKFYKRTAISL